VKILVAVGGLLTTACATAPAVAPVVVSGVTMGVQAIVCGLQTYAQDSSASPPDSWTQIALDLAKNCGLDVAQLVALFGTSSPALVKAAQDNAAAIHVAASSFAVGSALEAGK
jgi:hypothetical protein